MGRKTRLPARMSHRLPAADAGVQEAGGTPATRPGAPRRQCGPPSRMEQDGSPRVFAASRSPRGSAQRNRQATAPAVAAVAAVAALAAKAGRICGLAGLLLGSAVAAWSGEGPLDGLVQVRAFMDEVESRHGLDRAWLEAVFRDARRQQSILDAFARPAEAKPWRAYRRIFLTGARIGGGAVFVREHADLLERVRGRFGVPPEIVAAIIGVETSYGRFTGRYRVIDALSTLAFFSPRRGAFFRGELEEYLLMLREEGRAPADLLGSYAGAMGVPQFLPSSYRAYAVDFDGDGRRDLSGSVADAVGSVGSYLARHGWRPGEPVASRLTATDPGRADALADDLRPRLAWRDLEAAGLRPWPGTQAPAPESRMALVRLDGFGGAEYWAGFGNFYVITRYNRSALYAMAVHQLASEIRLRRR